VSALLTVALALAALLLLGWLLLRFNLLWIGWLDRAWSRPRDALPLEMERPRYYRTKPDGTLDLSARWPGWDGWYFFMIPDDATLAVQMVRGSVMTGLYGLDGVDNYDLVQLRLSTFDVVEHLCLVPTLETDAQGRVERENHLAQHYLPRASELEMKLSALEVAVKGEKIGADATRIPYGVVVGGWPKYRFDFVQPEAQIEIHLGLEARDLVWWADLPGVFTYFASFGRFEGELIYHRGARDATEPRRTFRVSGWGAFEHGFARKPFNFDRLWLPVRKLQLLFPSFRPIRYHYELFLGGDDLHGGFMKARGFGIDFRNHGGFYWKGAYHAIRSVKVHYPSDPPADRVIHHCGSLSPAEFPRKWRVEAATDDGALEYEGERDWPPAAIASRMMYYPFRYEGRFRGERIRGRGYGEYLHL